MSKALLLWPNDGKYGKTGIESIKNVPKNLRFVGACGPVRFSGDKKFYPAKVLLIDDNESTLEQMANEVAKEICARKEKDSTCVSRRRSRSKPSNKDSGLASEKAIALAVGARPQVPKGLEDAAKLVAKERKEQKDNRIEGRQLVDENVLSGIRKNLNQQFTPSAPNHGVESDSDDSGHDSDVNGNERSGGKDSEDAELLDDAGSGDEKNNDACHCEASVFLQKYDQPIFWNFLTDLASLGKKNVSAGSQYLEFLPLAENEPKVEIGAGVFLSKVDRDQLRVDYRNKPTLLARETLFALYGKETFQLLTVTGRGKKAGSYTIPKNVLKAVCHFVSKNVNAEKAMKTSDLATMINKRAPEWRQKSPGSKKSPNLKKPSKSRIENKLVVSTSPFKASPLKSSPQKLASPLKSSSPKKQLAPVKPTSPKNQLSPSKSTSPIKHASPSKKRPSPLKPVSTFSGAQRPSPSPAPAGPSGTYTMHRPEGSAAWNGYGQSSATHEYQHSFGSSSGMPPPHIAGSWSGNHNQPPWSQHNQPWNFGPDAHRNYFNPSHQYSSSYGEHPTNSGQSSTWEPIIESLWEMKP